ncbi:hypothetical protein BJ138DRAFT_919653 [Hygrophoropsis aurantiaca]|uniref:Uncharacterized protein n=1 Tax=Hygrophoropsis aurantiaca TaxID=72124 RepID=A0ACB8AQY0_9AGAM|nr:hypothetical protein BJ138DRAFT_919653 [Hygrophoropsis aurantiaca]
MYWFTKTSHLTPIASCSAWVLQLFTMLHHASLLRGDEWPQSLEQCYLFAQSCFCNSVITAHSNLSINHNCSTYMPIPNRLLSCFSNKTNSRFRLASIQTYISAGTISRHFLNHLLLFSTTVSLYLGSGSNSREWQEGYAQSR